MHGKGGKELQNPKQTNTQKNPNATEKHCKQKKYIFFSTKFTLNLKKKLT